MKKYLLALFLFVLNFSVIDIFADDTAFHEMFTLNGDLAGDFFGRSVSGAGDVNGDGCPDIIVGIVFGDDNGLDTGKVRVYSGKDNSVLYTLNGDNAEDFFGAAVSGAGDVNNDGFDDFIVGAPYDDNNGLDSGSARVYSGKDGTVLHTFNGDDAEDTLGQAVDGAGDVNGDGYADLIVGIPNDDNNGSTSGSARVYSGVDGSIIYTFDGDDIDDRCGQTVAGAGDVNGDGFSDVIVGIIYDDNNGIDSGSARVYSGKDAHLLHAFDGDSAFDFLGNSVDGAGDVNGDGVPDLIVGITGSDENGVGSGGARVYSGSDGSVLYTFYGDASLDYFGQSVSGAGDVDGDGFADLIIGIPSADNEEIDSGQAKVYSGFDGSVLYTFHGDGAGDSLGRSVDGIGDLNGDGRADVIVGADFDDNNGMNSGSARVFSGRPLYLKSDEKKLSLLQGGEQILKIHFPKEFSGLPYIILGSISGIDNGITIDNLYIPLNIDGYTVFSLNNPNVPPLTQSFGVLGAEAKATAKFSVLAGSSAALAGTTWYHSAIVFDGVFGTPLIASYPVKVTLEP